MDYAIRNTEIKEPGRHFNFSKGNQFYSASSKASSVKKDAFDMFENHYSKRFYESR